MGSRVLIGDRHIRTDAPPYVIAEIGVNHDGDIDRAIYLTEAAARAGADAVKLQFFEAERLMSRDARLALYQSDAGESDPTEMLRRLELPIGEMARVVRRAHELRIHAIVTVFSVELVASAAALPWDAFKSASPDIVHEPLLAAMAHASGHRPLIVSTGASTMEEVARARRWLDPIAPRLALLQCVSCYPTRETDAAVDAMRDLRSIHDGPIGYSDHTPGVHTGAIARARGATILEKHLTWDRNAAGPDHAASLDENGFAAYVALARATAVGREIDAGSLPMLGDGVKRVQECERDVREVSRQSVRAARDLRAGAFLRPDDLTFARPGGGLEPWRAAAIVGRALEVDVRRGARIDWSAVPSAAVPDEGRAA